MGNNAQILKDNTTASITSGLLKPEQSKQFIKQAFEATTLGKLIRREMRRAKTGEIDKIGIASRILRKKVENIDANSDGTAPTLNTATGAIDGYRANVNTSQVDYATTAVRLPWDITNETLRENIEGQGFEATVMSLMTTQLGIDLEDLYLNGDTAVAASNPDHDFLYINDGWIKQIAAGGHVVDATGITAMQKIFYLAVQALPNKYNNGRLRWLMSPHRLQDWQEYLLEQQMGNGSTAPDSIYNNPKSIPVVECPSMPDDKIILTDPQNLIVVNTYDIKVLKTDQGKEAIMRDKRFYVCHLDFDAIVEEIDATAIIENIGVPAPSET
jgi:hypothetical protein